MPEHIIDSCSLINLYSGWGQLAELESLSSKWYVGDTAVTESEFVREYQLDHSKKLVPLDLQPSIKRGVIIPVSLWTEAEYEDFVNFAGELDDGEAQALAIARHRKFVLLTDDRRAIRMAGRVDIDVPTISTPDILKRWSDLSKINERRLAVVIPRIVDLARFTPGPSSPLYDWWMSYLDA